MTAIWKIWSDTPSLTTGWGKKQLLGNDCELWPNIKIISTTEHEINNRKESCQSTGTHSPTRHPKKTYALFAHNTASMIKYNLKIIHDQLIRIQLLRNPQNDSTRVAFLQSVNGIVWHYLDVSSFVFICFSHQQSNSDAGRRHHYEFTASAAGNRRPLSTASDASVGSAKSSY